MNIGQEGGVPGWRGSGQNMAHGAKLNIVNIVHLEAEILVDLSCQ